MKRFFILIISVMLLFVSCECSSCGSTHSNSKNDANIIYKGDTYIPYRTAEEIMVASKEHGPYVKSLLNGNYYLIREIRYNNKNNLFVVTSAFSFLF